MLSVRPRVPDYPGPYTVGSTEYEIPISEIDTQTSPPDPKITTLKFRLFYPTDTLYKGQTVPWVPPPQRQWTEAFGRFLGASLGWSSVVNPMLSLMSYITIPAIPNAPLSARKRPWPTMVFSHGLAGNCNTYSSFCGSMAICGMIVAAVEHRDGSCPITLVRGADGKVATQVDYRRYSHNPTQEIFNARNTQLRTRMWELDLLYTVLSKFNNGEQLRNYATIKDKSTGPALSSTMDMRPGRVAWAGHSFGACSITQFVKSVYYNQALPSLKGTSHEHDNDWRPLFVPRVNSELIKQITPSSPVTLLDVWTMPFRAPSTQWLWERPMPCYDTKTQRASPSQSKPTTISILSTEFYNWTEMLNRTRGLLSADPLAAAEEISQQSAPRSPKMPKLEDTTTPRTPKLATPPNKHSGDSSDDDDDDPAAFQETDLLPPASLPLDDPMPNNHISTAISHSHSYIATADPIDRSTASTPSSTTSSLPQPSNDTTPADSPASSTTSLSPSITAKPAPQPQDTTTITFSSPSPTNTSTPAPAALYHIPHSAHLSQSDFGPLFPTLTRLLMKAVDPLGTMQLNVRAACQAVRNAGVQGVERVDVQNFAAQRVAAAAAAANGKKSAAKRGWFGFGWLRSATEVHADGPDSHAADEEENMEKQAEKLRQDTILQDTGIERWKELDVPVVAAYNSAR